MTDLSKIIYSVKDMCDFKENSNPDLYFIVVSGKYNISIHIINKDAYKIFKNTKLNIYINEYNECNIIDIISIYKTNIARHFLNISKDIGHTITECPKNNEILMYNMGIIFSKKKFI